jgi:hypothetical protein
MMSQRGVQWNPGAKDPLRIGDLLVVGLASTSPAQEADPLSWQGHDDDVLAGMRLLLAAGVEGLFFRAFRPLPPPLSPVDDEARVPSGSGWALSEVTGTPLGTNAELVQGLLEDRQEPMNPMVDLGLTQRL